MTLAQIGFLALVFVAISALVFWIAACGRRQRDRQAHAARCSANDTVSETQAERWVERVARATKPLANLSMPDEGFENSPTRLRFLHAGVRNAVGADGVLRRQDGAGARAADAGVRCADRSMRSPAQGYAVLMWLLGVAALGYYLPNMVLSRHRVRAPARDLRELPRRAGSDDRLHGGRPRHRGGAEQGRRGDGAQEPGRSATSCGSSTWSCAPARRASGRCATSHYAPASRRWTASSR